MWVLVIYDPETSAVEVRGPWDDFFIAEGAGTYYKERDEREVPALVAVAPVRPMVYFRPH